VLVHHSSSLGQVPGQVQGPVPYRVHDIRRVQTWLQSLIGHPSVTGASVTNAVITYKVKADEAIFVKQCSLHFNTWVRAMMNRTVPANWDAQQQVL
jgi:hypothetical protein